jgi:Fur family zinc uptake transcriptional regulator
MSTACAHARSEPPAPAWVRQSLSLAETRCAEAGQRWTRPRQRVFELLVRAGGPVKAYDLISGFGQDGAAAKPPTIYRALEFLEGLGLAHRIASLNAYVACQAQAPVHSASFLICDCCGSAEEFDPKVEAAAEAEAVRHGFRATALALEMRGLCRDCGG